jgi:hypothetical protein
MGFYLTPIRVALITVAVLAACAIAAHAQNSEPQICNQDAMIVFDASGSMYGDGWVYASTSKMSRGTWCFGRCGFCGSTTLPCSSITANATSKIGGVTYAEKVTVPSRSLECISAYLPAREQRATDFRGTPKNRSGLGALWR